MAKTFFAGICGKIDARFHGIEAAPSGLDGIRALVEGHLPAAVALALQSSQGTMVTVAADDKFRIAGKPVVFGVLVSAAYFAALLPILAIHGFDVSVFIVAGDRFVDAAKLASPIRVIPNSVGYDGEFYYRLALAPFSTERQVFGVMFDNGAWRMQRILYPLLVHIGALGKPSLVPALLFFTNLTGIGVIAAFAQRIAARLDLPAAAAISIVLWPGLLITLTRDTTEIVAVAFLLVAIDCYLRDRIAAFALFGALATLARETSILFLGGVALAEMIAAIRARAVRGRLVVCVLSTLPFLAWRGVQDLLWQRSLESTALRNMDWPLVGYAKALYYAVTGTRYAPGKLQLVHSVLDGAALLFLLGFVVACCIVIVRKLPRQYFALAVGWLMFLPLLFSLDAERGPLIEIFGSLRASTELFMVGGLLFYAGLRTRLPAAALIGCEAFLWVGCWATTHAFFRHV